MGLRHVVLRFVGRGWRNGQANPKAGQQKHTAYADEQRKSCPNAAVAVALHL